MRRPSFGEVSFGAVSGTIAGGLGGLLAVGLAAAIVEKNPVRMLQMPLLSFASWAICTPAGWLLGGQIGPRLGERLDSVKAEVIAGVICGLLPVVLMFWAAWYVEIHYTSP